MSAIQSRPHLRGATEAEGRPIVPAGGWGLEATKRRANGRRRLCGWRQVLGTAPADVLFVDTLGGYPVLAYA